MLRGIDFKVAFILIASTIIKRNILFKALMYRDIMKMNRKILAKSTFLNEPPDIAAISHQKKMVYQCTGIRVKQSVLSDIMLRIKETRGRTIYERL